jgi:outer membrane protein assembly factor BamA
VAPDPTRGDVRNFLLKRAVSFAMILAVGFLLLVSMIVSTLIAAFGEFLNDLLTGGMSALLLQFITAGVSFFAVTLLFAAMFRFVPDAVVRWRHALAGGAFTSLLFTLGKFGIGYWLGRSNPGSAFGAAGSLAVALLWIYYNALILLLGAEFTQALAERRGVPITPKPGAARVIRTHERVVRATPALVLLALVAMSFGASPAAAQAVVDVRADPPRVASISFNGVAALSRGDLRAAIVTQAQRCKSPLFFPFCWTTNWGTFEKKPRLDVEELARDELRIRVLYWRNGYRQATASSRLEPDGDRVRVIFDITEGNPTILTAVDVRQSIPLLDAAAIRRAGLPPTGEPLDITALDSAQTRLRAQLWQHGYADAVVRDTVLLSADGLSATVDIRLEPNARTTVEHVAVSGNDGVSTRTVERIVDLRAGQIFRPGDLADAQRRLYRSELFRQALLQVPEAQDSSKRVLVTVREAPFREVQSGVGFNTIEFVQAQARITRYNWLGGARKVVLNSAVGNVLAPQLYGKSVFGSAVPQGVADDVADTYLRPTWQVALEVAQPWVFTRRNSLSLGVFAHRRSVPGIVVDRGYGSAVTFTRELTRRTTASLSYRHERTRVEGGDLYFCVNFGVCQVTIVAALRGTQSMSPLQLNVLAQEADDPLAPTRGWTASFEAEHASGVTVSDFRYNRVLADATRYVSVGPGVLAARVTAGWVGEIGGTAGALGVEQVGRTLVHPRKRMYAGGSRSVRGYGENQLGPRILTIDPQRLIEPSDTSRGAACTLASIADGTCDPNVAPSDEFLPRPLGGSSVLAASIEYRLRLTKTLVLAGFVDGARVGDATLNVPSGATSAITPGFGIRYRSPIGPVRLDLGLRPKITEQLPVVTQIAGEDGQLQLVQLHALKEYDAVRTTGGFLRRVANRLQLHLSIGEAF